MKTFLNRLVSSLLFVLLVVFTIFIAPSWFFSLIIIALIALSLYEFYTMVESKGVSVYKYFGMILGIIVPLGIYLRKEGVIIDVEPLLIVLACLITVMLQLTRRDSSNALVKMSLTLFGILYISWFFSFIIKIKFMEHGALLCGFLVLVTKGGDIGAYIIGSLTGKHALIPRISPKKSVEGLLGGLASSFILAIMYRPLIDFIPFGHICVLGLLLGVLAQLGDLSESLIKRDCGVKDASAIFPGLGGGLDVLDSLLFTTPAFYFYMITFL